MQHERMELDITGRVQGVGMRGFLREHARRLKLVGYAQNRRDGSVHVAAEGMREQLEALIEEARKGPSWAKVDQVHVNWSTATGKYKTFRIR